eukprot:Rmarinus@m.4190
MVQEQLVGGNLKSPLEFGNWKLEIGIWNLWKIFINPIMGSDADQQPYTRLNSSTLRALVRRRRSNEAVLMCVEKFAVVLPTLFKKEKKGMNSRLRHASFGFLFLFLS